MGEQKIENSLHEAPYGGGLVMPYLDYAPVIGEDVYIAPTAAVIGRTRLGDRVSVWFGAVLRGDIAAVEVGRDSNIQDLCVLHVGSEDPCIVGERVVVGHRAILHGCRIGNDCLIGMGAIVLNGAAVGEGSLIGAGALVTEGSVIPPRSLALGSPAKVVRALREDEWKRHAEFAVKYAGIARNYRGGGGSI
ncbi:MAG: gamma carbonic anhydrase family protein [Candidatus Omnitrophica bacterium]|nr:gamma carbonic anhydrase family protein [Candidatus Omnitrophota bacterium]